MEEWGRLLKPFLRGRNYRDTGISSPNYARASSALREL